MAFEIPIPRSALPTGAPAMGALLVLALLVLAPGSVAAQFGVPAAQPGDARSWVHESWTVENGLPVNSINALVQDPSGYIWAATYDGLVRFDGVRFTVFNSANSEGLPSNRIVDLHFAGDGAIWVNTEQSHLVRFRAGRFTNFDKGGESKVLASLVEDSSVVVWAGTAQGLWTVQRDSLVRVAAGVIDAPVTAIMRRRDGDIWVGTDRAGVFRVARDGRATKIAVDPGLHADFIYRIHEDAAGTLWLAANTALWAGDTSFVPVDVPDGPLYVLSFLDSPATRALFAYTMSGLYHIDPAPVAAVDPRGHYLTGRRLWTDGHAIWHVAGAEVLRDGRHVFDLSAASGLTRAPPTITAALFDREGSLWLGTQTAGLHRLKPALFTTYGVGDGLADQNVYATYVDRTGAVWVGTGEKGASRIDPATGVVTSFAVGLMPASRINSFYADQSGRLWVAAAEGGVYVCTPPAMTCRAEGPAELHDTPVYALHVDSDGRLWAGGRDGLFRYDGRVWTRLARSAGAPEAAVRVFAGTRDGALWMGTNGGGLARYREGTFTHVTEADGLPANLIRSLYQDEDGWLWIGTEGRGLARLDPRAWSGIAGGDRGIARIGTRNGLFAETLHQILEDDAGRLWMNTNHGIFWVPRTELNAFADGAAARIHSTGYTERDGLRNREGNGGVQPAGAKGTDGRLWFPTQDGVVVVDPADVHGEGLRLPVVVEQVSAAGTARLPGDHPIQLAASERDLQIEYTALSFIQPSNVRFRYRLDGYDAGWVDAGSRRTAFYTKVPPGQYRFRVQASYEQGRWNSPIALVDLTVAPHFYETLWAKLLLGLALAAIATLAYRWRLAAAHQRERVLTGLVDARTAALRANEEALAQQNTRLAAQAVQLQALDRAKTRFFANVSHELRTPLTLTIGPLEDLRAEVGGDPRADRWLDLAMRNARRLLRLVNQILDVAKLEAGQMRLSPRSLDVAHFTRGVAAAFAPVAERKGVHLTVRTPESLHAVLDADAFEKILTNLLSNAIKFTPDDARVHVSLAPEEKSVRLVVRDSGPGIPPDQLTHVFERFYQVDESTARTQPGTGIGLSLVKELVDLQGGTVAVESREGETAFAVTLPLNTTLEPPAAAIGGAVPVDATRLVTAEDYGNGSRLVEDNDREDVPVLLVVDDSDDLRSYIRTHFERDFRVIEGDNGATGIALARSQVPDVVISDVMMPGTDGHELVRALRADAETEFIPVILLTAQAGDEQKIAGLERGADDYIVKPFDMRELDARVRNLMISRRRLRERFAGARVELRPIGENLAPADQALVDRIHEAIRQRFSDPDFGVGELAAAVFLDRSHLFRRTRHLMGESPSDLIRRTRLAEASRLLAAGSGTVADVAYAVGFNSVAYFSRTFQAVYGTTPATYRSRGDTR